MGLSTRELAAFVQKVAKLQPQDPPVYGSSRAYSGCTSCIPTLSGLGLDVSSVPWMWVVPSVLIGAGAMHLAKKTRLGAMLRKRSKKAKKKSRRARRNRRR